MRTAILASLVLLGALAAQDRPKELVEEPIKLLLPSPGPEKYDLAKSGIDWHEGIDAVLNRKQPILLFQLLGNLDDVYC